VNTHPILLGGDQLTAARARAAQMTLCGESTSTGRLEGLIPVFEDWHAKQALLVVSCNKLSHHTAILKYMCTN
jgi:L1 cell adhesion molecule like protein